MERARERVRTALRVAQLLETGMRPGEVAERLGLSSAELQRARADLDEARENGPSGGARLRRTPA